eukprot:g42771.t1
MAIVPWQFVLPYVVPPTLATKPLRVDTTALPTTIRLTTTALTTRATTIPTTLLGTDTTTTTRTTTLTTLPTTVPTTSVAMTNATAGLTSQSTTVPTVQAPTTVPTTLDITAAPTTQWTTATPSSGAITVAESSTLGMTTTEGTAPTPDPSGEALTTVTYASLPTTLEAPSEAGPITTVVPPTPPTVNAAITTAPASPLNSTEGGALPVATTAPAADATEPPSTRLAVPTDPRPDHPTTLPSARPVKDVGEWKEPDAWVDPVQVENDTAVFLAAAALLSGDGDVENPSPAFLHLFDTEVDYHYDPDSPSFSVQSHEGINKGPAACPCVNNIRGPPLLPVNTERKITLVGQNLHLFQ